MGETGTHRWFRNTPAINELPAVLIPNAYSGLFLRHREAAKRDSFKAIKTDMSISSQVSHQVKADEECLCLGIISSRTIKRS